MVRAEALRLGLTRAPYLNRAFSACCRKLIFPWGDAQAAGISSALVAKQQQSQMAYLNPTNFLRGKRRKAACLNFLAAFLAFSLPP
jgi:hypothetical protein